MFQFQQCQVSVRSSSRLFLTFARDIVGHIVSHANLNHHRCHHIHIYDGDGGDYEDGDDDGGHDGGDGDDDDCSDDGGDDGLKCLPAVCLLLQSETPNLGLPPTQCWALDDNDYDD